MPPWSNLFREYQTFNQIFASDITYSWKCNRPGCDWTSKSPVWERSLFLQIEIQKHIGRNITTEPLRGIENALARRAQLWGARKAAAPKCAKCSTTATPRAEIVNFPEVLILVRNTDLLTNKETPDILWDGTCLDLKRLGSHKFSTAGVAYSLFSGIAERRKNNIQYSSAFAQGGSLGTQGRWWFIDDDGATETANYQEIDRYQRPWLDVNKVLQEPAVLPEVFICVRIDDNGMRQQHSEQLRQLAPYGSRSPVEQDFHHLERDYLARSVTEIFAQPVGGGVLKFKITLTPADPGPKESMPFRLDIGYEFNGCQWALEDKMGGRLLPLPDIEPKDSTPIEAEPHTRFFKKREGRSISARGAP